MTLAAQSFAGIGEEGIGLGNEDNSGDVISVLGKAVFGGSGLGTFLSASPHPHGADVGRCIDADDDPADGAHHPVDGRL